MERETAYSETLKKEYVVAGTVRIVNPKQIAYYWQNDILLDIYPSNDLKTGEPIIVGVVNKKQSYPYYKKWLESRPQRND